jgi:hypothetical protein
VWAKMMKQEVENREKIRVRGGSVVEEQGFGEMGHGVRGRRRGEGGRTALYIFSFPCI